MKTPVWGKHGAGTGYLAVAGLLVLLSAGGCARVPEGNKIVSQAQASPLPPAKVIGAAGPLTEDQAKALLAKIVPAGRDVTDLERHLAIEQAVAGSLLVADNSVRVLKNGPETLRAMFRDIDAAKDHVNLEYFIFEDVKSDGRSLGDLLVKKRQQGVAVNVIYDDAGSSATPDAFFSRLEDAGVQFVEYNPVNPLQAKGKYAPTDRDHRKILVADGKVAIVGGVNLSSDYESFHRPRLSPATQALHEPQEPTAPPAVSPDSEFWRDSDLEIRGPAVSHVQQLFADQWAKHKGPALDKARFFPEIRPQGREIVRVIGSDSDAKIPRYYVTLLSAVRAARSRLWLTAAYFVPTPEEVKDIRNAARRGVDVRLLLPDHSDSEMALAAQHARYEDLLEAGVRIFETRSEVLHSKTVVIDGVWSGVGSSNFDRRSVLFNDEVDVVVLGADTGDALEKMFLDDIRDAREITAQKWRRRPLSHRLNELFAVPWEGHL
jgi:cardiolipin synthase